MQETMWLDDRFLDGLWYDGQTGDFCCFARGDGTAQMVNPETGDVYHEIERAEWNGADFTRVPQEALDDPEAFMEDFISEAKAQARDWPLPQYAALMFADENTTVRATEDRSYNDS